MAENGEERNYYVPFQAIGSVIVRAHDEDEAEELANELFGERELVEADAFEDLTFNHKWGPGIEETTDPITPVPPPPPDPVDPRFPRRSGD
jgi:hypothetical protein